MDELGLDGADRRPLIGMVSRLTAQKGIDLIQGRVAGCPAIATLLLWPSSAAGSGVTSASSNRSKDIFAIRSVSTGGTATSWRIGSRRAATCS